jgi:hypothetical protein
MRINFERSGGFANISLKAEIDPAELPPERAKELKRLVEKAHFFDQPASSAPPSMPDQFQYEVTIEDDGRSHTISTSDDAASDDLKLLFDFLGQEATKKLMQRK